MTRLKLLALVTLMGVSSSGAQTEVFTFNTFNPAPSLALQGSAHFSGGRLQLTPAGANGSGGVWFPVKRFLEAGFDTTFRFQLGNGAEGVAFVVQNNALPALGRSGSGLGYEGIRNSLAVEFDAVSSADINDLPGAHVSVQTGGALANGASDAMSITSAPAPALIDGNVHTARVRYVPGTLDVFLDDLVTPAATAQVTLTNLITLENGQAWFGIVAGNAGSGPQDLVSWSFNVANTALNVALASPLDGASFLTPAVVEVAANVSGPDPIASVEFFQGNQRLFGTNVAPYHFNWQFMLPGAYVLTAVATDTTGRKITSSPARMVVNPDKPAIGISFVTAPNGTNFTVGPQDGAGVIPQHYWNDAILFTNGNGSVQNLRDASGAVTPIDINYDFVARGEDSTINPALSDDHRLMRAHGAGLGQTNVVVQIQAIPFPIYDLIIYTDGGNGSADRVSQIRGPGRSSFVRDAAWTSFAGVYASAAGTNDAGANTPAGNYVRLNGLTLANVSITNNARSSSDGTLVSAINAIQIVPSLYDRNSPVIVTRGPYLQMGTPHSMMLRWRSNRPVSSRVRYGTSAGNLNVVADDTREVQEHSLVLTNLQPDTRYYYSIGTTETNIVQGTNLFFWTSPLTPKPTRVWVIGDSGTANTNAAAVRDAFDTLNGSRYVDLWLMLGDNAYNSGTDAEYQSAVFNMYTNRLPQTPVWPTIGNHETGQSHTPVSTTPYLSIFNLPEQGEAGGVPSGTERYYSFDYGDIHFVCLDSMTNERTPDGPMATWLRADLGANNRTWVIVFFHHPPYTKGSHNSDDNDVDFELVEMRENILPILESYGVDLVLSGHSHCYERSYLVKGHYGYSDSLVPSMILDSGSGNPADSAPYSKVSDGTVYVVEGSSGQATFGTMDHPVMYKSLLNLGSVILDIETNQLVARFLRETGSVQDTFAIVKPTPPPTPNNLLVTQTTGLGTSVSVGDAADPADDPGGVLAFLFEPISQSASPGADVLFLGTVYSDEAPTYQWRKNGVPIAGETEDYLYLADVVPADVGSYDVIATSGSLSITSQVARLTINNLFTKVLAGALVNERGNSTASAWGDFDGDGDLDVLVTHGANAFNSLFRNNGDGSFTKLEMPPITSDVAPSSGATWVDYDNDGWLDLLVINSGNNSPNFLYHNAGDGTFTRITNGIGSDVGNALTVAWGDYDHDGWLDLVTSPTGGGFGGPATGGLYHNVAGILFRNTNSTVGGLNLAQSAMWTDYNGDGALDLFFAVTSGGGFFGGPGNEILYRNNGNGTLSAIDEGPLVSSGGASTTASWADFDNDGDLDVFVGNGDGQVKFMFRNNGTNFTPVLGEIAEEEGAAEGSAWGDYDNDGWIDLFVANNMGGGNFLFHNNGDGTFDRVDAGSVTGDRANSVSGAWVDIDNDGFLDLFVMNLGESNFLYRNNGNSNHWLTVNCLARLSNRSAVGAKVRVLATIGGVARWQLREIAARDSSGSPNSLRAEFGLGDATSVTTVRVEWPSGLVGELHNIGANQFIDMTEPPVISISDAVVQEGDTGTRDLIFTVYLQEPSTNVVSVDFLTRNGSAIAGVDYLARTGTVYFAAGQTTGTVVVPVIGNLIDEPDRTFLVVLTNSINMAIGISSATGTIADDDPLVLTVDNASVAEGNLGTTNLVFSVYLNKPWMQPVTVDFSTANNNAVAGQDYAATNGTLVFNPREVIKAITVVVFNDTLSEVTETMFLNLGNISGAVLARNRASGTIVDDDPLPTIYVTSVPQLEGNSGTTPFVLSVSIFPRAGRTVSFSYATANGTAVAGLDFISRSGTVSLASGVTNTELVISVVGDSLPEGPETFNLNLSNPLGGVFATNVVSGTILDDDFRIIVPSGNDGTFSFVSVSNRMHRVERTFSLTPPVQWNAVPGAELLSGNGSTITVTDPAAGAPRRFYRVVLLQ
jgi:hypothetical protein